MDSTICVTFDTALVIAMEVTVDKATHCGQQSSDSMVSHVLTDKGLEQFNRDNLA